MAGTNPALVIRIAATIDELRRNLAEGKASIEALSASANKIAASFQGDKLAQQAANMAAAIQQVGGVAKLTAAEQARANSVFERAAEKLTLMGRAADPVTQEYKRLADATKRADTDTGFFATTIGKLTAAFSLASLIDRAVSSIISWGREAIVSAGAMVDLSSKTGLSLDTIQRMSFVAKQTSTDISTFTTAAFNLGVRLSGGGNSVVAAVDALKLSYQNLKAQSPDAQFAAITAALGQMEDPQKRNTLAVALFGKMAKDILPAIEQGYAKIADAAKVSSDAQIKAVDTASDRWTAFVENANSSMTSFMGNLVMNHDKAKGLDWLIVVGFDPNEVKKGIANISAWWDALRGKIAKQPLVPVSSFKDMVGDPLVLKDIPADLDAIEASFKKLTVATDGAARADKAFRDSVNRSSVELYRYGSMTLPTVTSGYESWIQRGIEANGLLKAGIPMWYDTAAATKAVGAELDTGTFNLNAWILGLKQVPPEVIKVKIATDGWMFAVRDLFDALAHLTGSAFVQWLGDVADAAITAERANVQLTQSLKDAKGDIAASAVAWGQWAGSVVVALDKATQSASKTQNALGGALAGAQAGANPALMAATGGWSVAIGAVAGLFVGLARDTKDSTGKIRQDFIHAAGGLEVLEAKARLAGVSLDRLFAAKRVESFAAELAWVQAAFDAWEKRVAGLNQAAGGLGSMTAGFAAPFEAAQAELDKLQKSLPALKQSLVDALKAGDPKGIRDAQALLLLARTHIKQLEKDLVVMAAKGQQQFTNLGTYALATFAGILKQTGSLSQAFDAVGPSIDALIKLQGSLGFTSSATVQALMDIRKVVTANQAVMQSVDGLNQVMAGLTAAGQINQTLFTAFGTDAVALFEQLKVKTGNADQALVLMQPTLQQLWQLQQTFGFEVDAGTQALLDQAVAQGIVGAKHKSVSDKMLEALLGIQGAVEALALVLKQDVGGALGDLGTKTRTNAGEWRTWGDNGVAQAYRVQRGLDAIEFPDMSVPGPGGGGVPSTMSAQSASSRSAQGGGPTSQSMSSTVGDVHVHFASGPSSLAEAEEKGFIVADTVIKLLETNAGGRRTKARKALRVA